MTEQKPKVWTNFDMVDLEVSLRSNEDVDDLEMSFNVTVLPNGVQCDLSHTVIQTMSELHHDP